MKHRWAALGLVLALSALMTSTASAQTGSGQQGQRGPGPLGQNFPNPFNPETTIPFAVGYDEGNPPVCTDPSRVYRVSEVGCRVREHDAPNPTPDAGPC